MKEQFLTRLERYLVSLSRSVLAINEPLIIGVTGSVGKTTTRDAIYQVLSGLGLSVAKTSANLNTELGISLAIFGYDHSPAVWEWPWALLAIHLRWLFLLLRLSRLPRYFVVELGVDRLGDMARLLDFIRPTIGVVTWIGEGHHLEFLVSPAMIAREKGQILAALPKNGLAIIPAQDPQTPQLARMSRAPVVKIVETGLDATPAIIAAIADYLQLDQVKVSKIVAQLERPKGRLHRLAGLHGAVIIDDSYNASLPATRLGLAYLASQPAKRRIAVLGDVLEQGEQEVAVHQTIGKLARQSADLFIGVGRRMLVAKPDQHYDSPETAAVALAAELKKGDVVLVKGSQGMRMEKVSYALAADKTEAKAELSRQSRRWQQIPFRNP